MTASSLFSGFIFGVIGFYLIRESRRRGHLQWALIGLALMIYPLFSTNPWYDWGGGLFLCWLAYTVKNT